ncbi:hypothetical protein [Cellulomonas hominis]
MSTAHRPGPGRPSVGPWLQGARVAAGAVSPGRRIDHIPQMCYDCCIRDRHVGIVRRRILSFRPSRTALGSAAARAAHLIVDGEPTIYADPLAEALRGLAPHLRGEPGSAYAAAVGQAAGENGEPWLSTWTPADLTAALRHAGFTDVTHRTQRDAIDPALWDRTDALRPMALSGLVQATVGPR